MALLFLLARRRFTPSSHCGKCVRTLVAVCEHALGRTAAAKGKPGALTSEFWGQGWRSSRQGCNLAGESPAVTIARFSHVAMPQLGAGNEPSYAWCIRPSCSKVKSLCSGCNQKVKRV